MFTQGTSATNHGDAHTYSTNQGASTSDNREYPALIDLINGIKDKDLLRVVLAYASAGWDVFPCIEYSKRGKQPYIAGGFHSATTDPTQIRAWWGQHPYALIGMAVPSGVVVLDFDPRHGGTPHALEEFLGEKLPDTYTVRTGSGGWHYYYQTANTTIGNSNKGLPDGVDVRANGHGYVIVPPSVHPTAHVPYKVENDMPLQALPDAVETILDPNHHRDAFAPIHGSVRTMFTGHSGAGLTGLIGVVAHAPKGDRNNALYWAACRMFERERDGRPTDFPALTDAAYAVGLTDREAATTIASARTMILGGGAR